MFSLANPVDIQTLTKHNIMYDSLLICEPVSQTGDELRGLGYAKYCGKKCCECWGKKWEGSFPLNNEVIARGPPREAH